MIHSTVHTKSSWQIILGDKRVRTKLVRWMIRWSGIVGVLLPFLGVAQQVDCPTITNTTQTSVAVCSGYIVDSLQVKTTAVWPTKIELVRFESPQTDPYFANGGVSLGELIASNTIATMRTISFPVNTGLTAKTYFVYARLKPVPTDETCRPFAVVTVTIRPSPMASGVAQEATCQGSVSLADGGVRIINFSATDRYEIANNGLFSGSSQPIPRDGMVVRNATRSGQVAVYALRVYNTFTCYTAQTVTLTNQPCSCAPGKCVPIALRRVVRR